MTQTNAILKFLRTGASISAIEALNLFGCMNLKGRIWDIKQLGHVVQSKFVSANGKKFKRYWI